MKPLLQTVVVICLLLATHAHPENIEEVKELPQSKDPVVEAEESDSQTRIERCTTCSSVLNLSNKSPKEIIATLQSLPGGEVHTQQSFDGCSGSKGCASLKLQDGKVTEKFGNINAFGGENAFNAGSAFASNALGGKTSGEPFWWMGDNSPFKKSNSESYVSKTSSTSFASGGAGALGAGYGGALDIANNAFLNQNRNSFAGSGQSTYDASSSSFQSNKEGGIDVANNPFLNGNINLGQTGLHAGQGFVASQGNAFSASSHSAGGSFQNGFGASSQSAHAGNAGAGYIGSSPSPFASNPGSNVNHIQNTQKVNGLAFDQTQQTVNDEIFQGSTNFNIQAQSGGDLQQTCAGQEYACVLKSQCSNGVVNTNGAGILQAGNKKQYCNTRTETCCRVELSSITGAGASQSNLGLGFTTADTQSQVSGQTFAGQNSFGVVGNQGAFGLQSGSNGAPSGFGTQGSSFGTQSGYDANRATLGFGSTPAVTSVPVSSTGAFGGTGSTFAGSTGSYGSTLRPDIFQGTGQNNFNTDSSSSQSESQNVYRPGSGVLKPGVPYLPPVDNTNSGSNVVSSTVYPSTFDTTPRPFFTPRPVSSSRPITPVRPVATPRPYTTPRPTYLPPVSSTSAPGYLPPVGEQTINRETFVPSPGYNEGGIILDETRQPPTTRQPFIPLINDIPAGCAAALKCTPIEFCTAEGVISNTTVILTRDQNTYRVPLTNCKDVETGRIGKCCRDPFYTDPWPTNQLGKWVHGVFGGNDGKYDSRTDRPDYITGSTVLNNFRTVTPTTPTNQVTSSYTGQGGIKKVTEYGQGQVTKGGVGQFGIGQIGQTGVGQYGETGVGQVGKFGFGQKGQVGVGKTGQVGVGQIGQFGVGKLVQTGVGQYEETGVGQVGKFGIGQKGQVGVGQIDQTGFGIIDQGEGEIGIQEKIYGIRQGEGAIIKQGQGELIKQGVGHRHKFGLVSQGITKVVENGGGGYTVQGGGFGVRQGVGSSVENEVSASTRRVYLQRYNGTGQCGLKNGQKPYGNHDDLEVDFAEIPWQAMVLLQTNKSLLCGGVISRPDVVITSAACVDGLDAKNVLVKGGEWKLGIDDEPLPFQIVHVKTIVFHPGYQPGSLQNDVAILHLAEDLRLANNIQPICMPDAKETQEEFYSGVGECIVTGWGKQVLQAHISGAIMHSVNVSLIEPTECEAKIQQDYPHLLDNYDQESCACGQPTNPLTNICRVDIGSALACTTGDGYFVLKGVYSWDSGCQTGNQLAAFYKFDIEWYEWAIGVSESVRYEQYGRGTKITQTTYTTGQVTSGTKGTHYIGGVKEFGVFGQGQRKFGVGQDQAEVGTGQAQIGTGQAEIGTGQIDFTKIFGQGKAGEGTGQAQIGSGQIDLTKIFGQGQISTANFSQFSSTGNRQYTELGTDVNGPISNTFTYTELQKKYFQTDPKFITYTTKPEFVTYTTKPEIVTYTTKPEIYTYTTKPKIFTYTTKPKIITYTTKPKIITYTTKPKFITYTTKPEIITYTTKPEIITYTTKPEYITYTTKPQIISYETSGSGTNPQYVAPGVTFNPSFSELVNKQHKHNAQCHCLENGKK